MIQRPLLSASGTVDDSPLSTTDPSLPFPSSFPGQKGRLPLAARDSGIMSSLPFWKPQAEEDFPISALKICPETLFPSSAGKTSSLPPDHKEKTLSHFPFLRSGKRDPPFLGTLFRPKAGTSNADAGFSPFSYSHPCPPHPSGRAN